MSRTLVPLAIGGASVSYIRWRFWRVAVETLVDHSISLLPQLVHNQLVGDLDAGLLHKLYQVGGVWIAWELRFEIIGILRCLLHIIWYLCYWVVRVVSWISEYLHQIWVGAGTSQSEDQLVLQERGVDLTSMALVAGGAGAGGVAAAAPFRVGSFVLISRPPHWDEIWIAGTLSNHTDVVARTTVTDGSDWTWVVVRLVALGVKSPLENPDGTRRAPAGVPGGSINWIYVPPNCDTLWTPDPVEVITLSQEAQLIVGQLNSSMSGVTVNMAGVAGDMVGLAIPGGGQMGPGGSGAAPGGGGAGLGLQSGGAAPTSEELKALEKAVQQLQAMAISSEEERKKSKRKKEKKSKKSDKKDKKKRKKKKKRSDSTSSSSSGSRSRSRSSSSSASSSRKPLVWKEKGKDKKVSYEDLTHVDQLRLKKKGDLLNFAAKNPGALTAHFLAGVYARLSKGTIHRSSQLREASVSAWAHQHSGLTEPRDLKEVLTLAEVLDHVNRREIARALDIIVQRIVAIQSARQKGGTWEKAENLELINSQRTLASSSMLALTNA